MKIRTSEHVFDALSADLGWRKKEISVFRSLIDRASSGSSQQQALLRAGVALLYAHWEGFTKTASKIYLEYLHYAHLTYADFVPGLLALAARRQIAETGATSRIDKSIELVKFFRARLGEQARFPYREGLSTRSNLNADVLREILVALGLDFGPYETKTVLIDEKLVASRNSIAHGEYLAVDARDYDGLVVKVVEMMEELERQVDNATALGAYKAA